MQIIGEYNNTLDIEASVNYMSGVLDLYQNSIDEEGRIASIVNAFASLEEGQFGFYDLYLSDYDRYVLSHVEINQNGIKEERIDINNFDNFSNSLQEKTCRGSLGIKTENCEYISSLIAKIVSNIISVTHHNNMKVILRTESARADNVCTYWHIDKSDFGIEQQKLFIVPLFGEPTFFPFVGDIKYAEFMKVANETKYYYGHHPYYTCNGKDELSLLFASESTVSTKSGYGSVHIKGRGGTIHAAPNTSSNGRLVLLVTTN